MLRLQTKLSCRPPKPDVPRRQVWLPAGPRDRVQSGSDRLHAPRDRDAPCRAIAAALPEVGKGATDPQLLHPEVGVVLGPAEGLGLGVGLGVGRGLGLGLGLG